MVRVAPVGSPQESFLSWSLRMSHPEPDSVPDVSGSPSFLTTRWSLVLAAQGRDVPGAREALAKLCEAYWYPLYAFIRRKGHSPEDSLDFVQGFFERLLEGGVLAPVDQAKGRLRSFLMAACSHHLANRLDHDRARKRGGGRRIVSIDGSDAEGRYLLEPSHELTAERLFERRWATTLVATVMARLEGEMEAAGKSRQFVALKPTLSGGAERGLQVRIAAELGLSREAARAAVHRLRRRFRDLIREEILATLDDPADVEEEIRSLFAALAP
jgi:DNA-directed RNA polymerase specialized sigma24 family protein